MRSLVFTAYILFNTETKHSTGQLNTFNETAQNEGFMMQGAIDLPVNTLNDVVSWQSLASISFILVTH